LLMDIPTSTVWITYPKLETVSHTGIMIGRG